MLPEKTIPLFEEVIHTRGIYHELGITQVAVKDLRRNHKLGKVSLDKMREILKLAGYQVVQETKWSK